MRKTFNFYCACALHLHFPYYDSTFVCLTKEFSRKYQESEEEKEKIKNKNKEKNFWSFCDKQSSLFSKTRVTSTLTNTRKNFCRLILLRKLFYFVFPYLMW